MRILKLRVKNVNSLKGEYCLDFTTPPLNDSGIFAIVGPTGSGKSTLLDCLTLALYNRIPRLGLKKRLSPNEIKNHGALLNDWSSSEECLAEVEYEVAGQIYRSRWQMNCRKGEPQEPKMELSRLPTGEIVSTKRQEVPQLNAQFSGLDVDRFLKSVLLAQGDFARFLLAKEEERGQLLEKITGAEVYRRIGQLAFERAKYEEQKLTLLQEKEKDTGVIDPEVRKEWEEQLRALEKGAIHLQSARSRHQKYLDWHLAIEQCTSKTQTIEFELDQLAKAEASSQEELEALALFDKFLPYLEPLRQYQEASQQLKTLTSKVEQVKADLTKHHQTKEASFEQVAKAEEGLEQAVHNRNEQREKLQTLITLIAQANQQSAILTTTQKSLEELGRQLKKAQEAVIQVQQKRELLEARQKELEATKTRQHLEAKYDQDRELLQEGSPCFLCGSTVHPYKKAYHCQVSSTEQALSACCGEIKTVEKQLQNLQVEQAKAETLTAEKRVLEDTTKGSLEKTREEIAEISSETSLTQPTKSSVNEEIARLDEAVKTAQQTLAQHQKALHEISTIWTQHAERLKLLEQQVREMRQKIQTLKGELKALNVPEPEKVLSQLLSPEQADTLRRKHADRKAKQTVLAENLSKLHQEKRSLLAAPATTKPLDEVKAALSSFTEKLAKTHEEIGSRKNQLLEDTQRQKKKTQLTHQIQKQSKEWQRWQNLSDLIGDKEGRRFTIFAQSVTLQQLVSRANEHLKNLSPRYELTQPNPRSLRLDIRDTYQVNALRSVETLSGGESFLVSLALALGLSDLAGHHTSIDSLFIDEGFGALDPDSLDVALSTLEALQATSHKTIGIISHVEALKERMKTQVRIIPQSSGFSALKVVGG